MLGVAVALTSGLRTRRQERGAAISSWRPRPCAWRSTTSSRGRSCSARARSDFSTAGMAVGGAALVLISWLQAAAPACTVRPARLDRGLLSCGRRRRARVFPVGVCAAARQPHAGRQHHDRQSAGCRAARGSAAERAGHAQLSVGLVAVFAGIWVATTEPGSLTRIIPRRARPRSGT